MFETIRRGSQGRDDSNRGDDMLNMAGYKNAWCSLLLHISMLFLFIIVLGPPVLNKDAFVWEPI